MIDKVWLERMLIAYKVYPYPNAQIEKFIRWMYEQYGIVPPDDKK